MEPYTPVVLADVSAARRAGFAGLMLSAMAVATAVASALGIVATYLIDDLGISRGQMGALIGATQMMAAVVSPAVGGVADRIGGRRALAILFLLAAGGFLGMAVSPVFWVMFLPAGVAAVGQSASNPATNKLIGSHLPPGQRGTVAGIKQSGVQLGVFAGGLLLPVLVEAVGWRWAFTMAGAVPLIVVPMVFVFVRPDGPGPGATSRADRAALPGSIRYLAIFGALVGFGGSFVFLVPLFVEEAVGMSARAGGLAAGIVGLSGAIGRIAWARYAESRGVKRSLMAIGIGGVIAALVFSLSGTGIVSLVWIGAILTGLTTSSWHSVGMLAVIIDTGPDGAGRASGVVMFGFLTGMGVGPPLFGWIIDQTGSYAPMWVICLVSLTLSVVVVAMWRRRASHFEGGRFPAGPARVGE